MKADILQSIKWFAAAGVLMFLFMWAFGPADYLANKSAIGIDFLMSVFFTVFISSVQTFVYNIISQRFPYEKGIVKRVFAILFLMTLSVSITMLVVVFIVHHLVYVPYPELCASNLPFREIVKMNLGTALVMNLLITLTVEAYNLFQNWKQSLLKAEQLEREKIESELNALKNQINPHFLFNSLNTLNSIMRHSVPKAENYIQRFSSLYRYVLNVKDKSFVPLSEELKLVNDYVFLQKERFGEALQVNIEIEEVEKYHIPPLCLHELLENALKHNKFGSSTSMYVYIQFKDNQLEVRNSYMPLAADTRNANTGQKNMARRYELLNLKIPQFSIEDGYYVARISLMKEE